MTLIDTAPVYGFGRSEEIVGKALEGSLRHKVTIATKLGLAWKDGVVYRDSRPARVRQEIEDSLRRLRTDVIDLYQVHWPDFETPIAETARTMEDLRREGKIRTIGVSNFSPTQMRMFGADAQLDAVQPPYNLFERAIGADVLPYAVGAGLAILSYGALCRGLLSGRMTLETKFNGDDLRKIDPKFQVSASANISPRLANSRNWPRSALANRYWRLRCAGCSIKAQRSPSGVPGIPASSTRSVISKAGKSTRRRSTTSDPQAPHRRSGVTGIHGAAGNPTERAEMLGGLSAITEIKAMSDRALNVIAICGSLRQGSHNRMLMDALPGLAPTVLHVNEVPTTSTFSTRPRAIFARIVRHQPG